MEKRDFMSAFVANWLATRAAMEYEDRFRDYTYYAPSPMAFEADRAFQEADAAWIAVEDEERRRSLEAHREIERKARAEERSGS